MVCFATGAALVATANKISETISIFKVTSGCEPDIAEINDPSSLIDELFTSGEAKQSLLEDT